MGGLIEDSLNLNWAGHWDDRMPKSKQETKTDAPSLPPVEARKVPVPEFESQCVEMNAVLEAIDAALDGVEPSDFMLSFPIVRKAWDAISSPQTWQPIETAPAYKAVLTQHIDDLYPTVAFRVENDWMRETEGPEDTFDKRSGKYEHLYRSPTHWMPLPDPPVASLRGGPAK